MHFTEFTTKIEFAQRLKMSMSTFQRKLKEANITVSRGLICPKMQKEIFKKLNGEADTDDENNMT
ncbi:MAG: hypothetical protein HC803_00775 [Saprospiraceae bacterium]|nr:hypothetical protein [Saprospiraceae bacterium]